MKEIIEKLKNAISGDVMIDGETLDSHSRDWSLFEITPAVVIFPKNAADITSVVNIVNEHKDAHPELSLTMRAAGTDMTGGPLNDSIIVDTTKYMHGINLLERTDAFPNQSAFYEHKYVITGHAKVLPGTMYRDFEIATHKEGLEMPCYPASKDICAVGGMVGNNGAGEKSLKYGQNKDFVHSLDVVLSDGNAYNVEPLTFDQLQKKINQNDFEGSIYKEIYALVKDNWGLIDERKPRTSKNAAGYYLWDVISTDSIDAFENDDGYFDLTKLVVGAQGSTALITEIEYKLVDVQQAHDLLVVYVKDLAVVPELVQQLMKSDLEMLEMYDDNTFKIGIKFFKDFLKDKGFFGAIKYSLRFLPEAWMALTRGIPRLIVLAEFSGNSEEDVHRKMTEAQKNIADLGLASRKIPRDAEEEKFWDFRHDSFKILTEHSSEAREKGTGTRTAPFIDDIAVNPKDLPEYLPKLIELLDSYDLMYTIAGHLGNGNFHIIPLMGFDEIGDGEKILEISDKVYELALQYEATITAEHNDGIIRTPYLRQQFGDEMIALFQKIKDIFDPTNIFNPGKKVGLTKADIKRYIAKQ